MKDIKFETFFDQIHQCNSSKVQTIKKSGSVATFFPFAITK